MLKLTGEGSAAVGCTTAGVSTGLAGTVRSGGHGGGGSNNEVDGCGTTAGGKGRRGGTEASFGMTIDGGGKTSMLGTGIQRAGSAALTRGTGMRT